MKINIDDKLKHPLPACSTEASAGLGVRATLDADVVKGPAERSLVKIGLFGELPVGYEDQIRPKGCAAISKGITVLISPGTFYVDYRGEICIILVNLSGEKFVIKDGERICRMVIAKHKKAVWVKVENLIETERVSGGFGHTGKN